MILFVLLGLLLFFPTDALAVHDDVSPYTLFVERPVLKFKDILEDEFSFLTHSEIYEHADREELDNREWHHLMPEFIRPLSAAGSELSSNALSVLSEEVEIFSKLRVLYEKYGYPRADIRILDKKLEVSVSKPPPGPLGGFRLGLSQDLDHPSSPEEIFLPTPYFKCDFRSLKCRVRYNPLNQTLRINISAEPKNWEDVRLRGMLEYDLGENRQRAEFTAAKKLPVRFNPFSQDYSPLLKFRFRWERASHEKDFFWCRSSCWEAMVFLAVRF